MMKLRHIITIGDCVVIASLLVGAGGLFFLLPGWVLSAGTQLVIISDDRVAGRYPLEQDRRIEVDGPLGTTRIELKDGHAAITASPCPHKVCTEMGTVSREGGIIVCVPNKIAVSVGQQPYRGIDAVSR